MANNIINGAGFHHIALKTTDLDKSIKFYTEGLGLKLLKEWGEGDDRAAMVDIGDGGIIELFAGGVKNGFNLREKFKDSGLDEVPCYDAGIWGHLALRADDVDAAFERALACDAIPTKKPCSMTIASNPPMDIRIAFVLGLDGEIIEFFKEG